MKVFVYYNLHKHLWSVKALEGDNKGKVIAHRRKIVLHNPIGKVSEAGRQRVLRDKCKNVHAGLVGHWFDDSPEIHGEQITYNPYKYASFVYAANEQPFNGASLALMEDRKVYVV
jgi:hypothetical protein